MCIVSRIHSIRTDQSFKLGPNKAGIVRTYRKFYFNSVSVASIDPSRKTGYCVSPVPIIPMFLLRNLYCFYFKFRSINTAKTYFSAKT